MTEPRAGVVQRPARPPTDPLELAAAAPPTDDEAGYVAAARAANTLRGYRSDWAEFTGWCVSKGLDPLPGIGHGDRLPDRAGPGRSQGGHHEPAAVGDPVRGPAAQLPRPARQRPGGRGLGGDPAHARRPADPGRAADAAGAVRRPGRLPPGKEVEDQGPAARAGPGRAARCRPAAGRVRGRAPVVRTEFEARVLG